MREASPKRERWKVEHGQSNIRFLYKNKNLKTHHVRGLQDKGMVEGKKRATATLPNRDGNGPNRNFSGTQENVS